ncbi:Outer membrane porin F [Palleronia abyssalis]|uniref:Outer membrane porin F n=1 Tax=Palleronia abyssalis TaxID=1501240 RepID=A0A2R8BW92_9RHOB|nr:Outer membrane porin F [Palleronia abyssalis]
MAFNFIRNVARAAGLAVFAAGMALGVQGVEAQQRAVGTIWIDPDGCEHWVRDDGWEGYGSNRLTRQGLPVCHKVETCGVMSTDVLFATDSAKISRQGQQYLQSFFGQTDARAYTIIGHTDSRASDEYNIRLSYNRANAVARYAAGMGRNINDVRGYGERQPAASNQTAAGMQQNRRVEIICIR